MCNSNNKIKHTFCNNNLARPFLCTLFVLAPVYALIAIQVNLLILLIIFHVVFCGNLEILLQTVQSLIKWFIVSLLCISIFDVSSSSSSWTNNRTTIAIVHMEYCKIRGCLLAIELSLPLPPSLIWYRSIKSKGTNTISMRTDDLALIVQLWNIK